MLISGCLIGRTAGHRRERGDGGEPVMMTITRATTVRDAVASSKAARDLFIKHGIDPEIRCVGMYDINTLDDVEQYCRVKNVDTLIGELNAAIAVEDESRA
jgi:hypothetical protein